MSEFRGYDNWKLDCGPCNEVERYGVEWAVLVTHADGTETPYNGDEPMSEALYEDMHDLTDAARLDWLFRECVVVCDEDEPVRIVQFKLYCY